MADNVTLSAGSGGATLATDEISSVHYQLIKLGYGALDSFTIVTASAGLPVAQQGTWTVTGAGGTFPVTGTFWQATQPVSIASTVTVTGAAGTFPVTDSGGSLTVDAPVGTPVFVRLSDGSSAISTLPVSMAAVPTGASTAAKQPALGTAGTASADVITVQGIASMTALKVDGSAVTQPVSGTFWQATQPVSLASTVTVTGAGGTFPVTNAGTFVVQENGAALTSLQLIDDVVFAEDAAAASGDKGIMALAVRRDSVASSSGTDGDYSTLNVDANGRLYVAVNNIPAVTQSGAWSVAQSGTWNIGTVSGLTAMNGQTISMGTGTRDAGTQRVTIATNDTVPASQSGTWTVQPGNTQNTTAWLVSDPPVTSGGPTVARIKSASGTNATNVKNAAGQIYGYDLSNNTSSARWVHFYNSGSTPTAGSGTPAFTVLVPASGGKNIYFQHGIPMSNGIGYTITTGASDSDTGSCSADDVHGVLLYK